MKKLLFILTLVLAALLPVELWAQSTTGGDDGSDAVAAPTFRFDGDYLVIETVTEDASIFYQMADLPDMSDETIEKISSSMTVTPDVSQSMYYEQPILLQKSVVLKAIAAGATNSEVSTLVYDYDAWNGLLEAIEYGWHVQELAKDNANVDADLKEELQWALDESKHIFDERATIPYQEAQHFANQIYDICDKIEEQMSGQATAEPYAVLSENNTVLTFYYDDQKVARNGMGVGPFYDYSGHQAWYNQRENITSVVFDISFANCTTLTSTAWWFYYCENLISISGIENLKTDNVMNMSYMYAGCRKLTNIDLSNFKTDNVTDMSHMFDRCSTLTNLNLTSFKTDNVVDMSYLFEYCTALTDLDISSFRTDNVIDMEGMFYDCESLTKLDVTNFKTDKVENMAWMFMDCSSLTSLDVTNFNTSNVTNMSSMFSGCSGLSSLDVTAFKTDNVVSIGFLFYGCSGLEELDISNFKTDKVINMRRMFGDNHRLTSLDLTNFNTDKVTDMWRMFHGCTRLSTIFVGNMWSTIAVENGSEMFTNCTSLFGGKGTVYDASHTDHTYAHIDGGENNPGYFTDKNAPVISDEIIQFADANVKAICVQNWDTNADGELSTGEASAVTDLGGVFKNQTSCTSFDELRFFTSLTALGADEFRSCPFTSVILPPSLQSIGRYAFDGTKLTEITIPASVTYIDGTGLNDRSFLNFYVDEASNSFCAVDGVLFSKDTTLLQNYPVGRNDASYVIPNTVTTIGSCSFYGSKLASVVIPNGVKRIDYGAFRYCSLESIDIPNTVEIIEGENFQYCDRLTFVFVPNSVSFLGEDVFSACASLATIDVDSNNPNYASVDGILYSKDLTTLQIYPAGRPETSYTIADHVKVIGSHAFDFAVNLVSVVIPNSVESIGYLNFVNISGLMSVTVQRAEPIQIGTGYFNSNTLQNGTLYVPKGAKPLYEAAEGWNKFNNIVEIESEPTFSFDGFGVLTVWGGMSLADALEAAGGRAEVAKTITAVVWNNETALSSSDLQELTNPNMLIYVAADSLAPQNRDNVIVGDMAKNIVLTDVTEGNGNFYCPQDFKAEMISYTRNFSQQTEVGVARGWESIALPFTVQTITHEKQGVIAPFNNTASNKHFWLRQVAESENGGRLTGATTIEAYTPYLISMPNSEAYPAEYCLNGQVTFSAQDALVGRTELYPKEIRTADGGMIMMVPCFGGQTATQDVYALNVGVQLQGYPEGSVFVRASRDVRPFEVFTVHHGGNAPQLISIQDLNGGSMTGIEDVRSMMSDGRGNEWFDLSGRKLQGKPSRTGVYIVNGKKKVVK